MTRKNPAAVALGRKGGKARVQKQSAEERRESSRRAAQVRWARQKKLVSEITEGTKELLKVAKKHGRRMAKKS